MQQPKLTHVAFNCPELEPMLTFYRDYAGMHVVHDRMDGDLRVVWLSADPDSTRFIFVCIEGPGQTAPDPPAMEHLGFEGESRADVDAVVARARADGVTICEGPNDWPAPVGYFVILADPCGNRVEFAYPPGK